MKHCPICGNPLNDDAHYCNRCGAPTQETTPTCPRCGSHTQPGDVHCSNCGYPLNSGFGPGGPIPPYAPPQQRSRFLAGILAILMGTLGIHNFYLGYTQRGVIQLLLGTVGAVFTCGLSALAVEIWAVVEAILLFTRQTVYDGNGLPLRD